MSNATSLALCKWLELEAGYSSRNMKPSCCAVLQQTAITISGAVCDCFHRYAWSANLVGKKCGGHSVCASEISGNAYENDLR